MIVKDDDVLMHNIVDSKLVEYIEREIFPIYKTFDKGHDLTHILSVIERAFEISKDIDNLNPNIIYASAALHDIGIQKQRKNHALYSAIFVRNNPKLRQFFSNEQIAQIADAVEDHSTSRGIEPRNIYGKIVCDADKDADIEVSLLRSYEFTKAYFPDYTEEECLKNVYEQLVFKFGTNGKVKYWINSQKQQTFLQNMKSLAEDESLFRATITRIIKEKNRNEITSKRQEVEEER